MKELGTHKRVLIQLTSYRGCTLNACATFNELHLLMCAAWGQRLQGGAIAFCTSRCASVFNQGGQRKKLLVSGKRACRKQLTNRVSVSIRNRRSSPKTPLLQSLATWLEKRKSFLGKLCGNEFGNHVWGLQGHYTVWCARNTLPCY